MTTQRQRPTSRSGHDWRLRIVYEQQKNAAIPTAAELARIRCPFEITPEVTPIVPIEYTENVRHYTITTQPVPVPWTGYYATYQGAKLAVASAYGVWFEIRRKNNSWQAIRPARTSLKLNDWPLEGIDVAALAASGEPILITRLYGPRAPTAGSTDEESEEEEPIRTNVLRSSQTERGRGSRQPRNTGDDPLTPEDDHEDVPTRPYVRLKGRPPKIFDGDRSRTHAFLAQFDQFMLMNREATTARDPTRKCRYFLSLITGPNVEWWTLRQDEWLDKVVEADPATHMTAWQTLEQEFKNAFIDSADRERAQLEIGSLRMKEGNVDRYIAEFKELARRGGYGFDEPANLLLFARGLPKRLAENCIEYEDPETFEEWVKAAQKQQQKWLDKHPRKDRNRNVFGSSGSQPPIYPTKGRKRQNQGNAEGQSWRAPTRQSAPRDPNVMDTSAPVGKAMTDAEKQKYLREGRCFECSKQGHFARDCFKRKARR